MLNLFYSLDLFSIQPIILISCLVTNPCYKTRLFESAFKQLKALLNHQIDKFRLKKKSQKYFWVTECTCIFINNFDVLLTEALLNKILLNKIIPIWDKNRCHKVLLVSYQSFSLHLFWSCNVVKGPTNLLHDDGQLLLSKRYSADLRQRSAPL